MVPTMALMAAAARMAMHPTEVIHHHPTARATADILPRDQASTVNRAMVANNRAMVANSRAMVANSKATVANSRATVASNMAVSSMVNSSTVSNNMVNNNTVSSTAVMATRVHPFLDRRLKRT